MRFLPPPSPILALLLLGTLVGCSGELAPQRAESTDLSSAEVPAAEVTAAEVLDRMAAAYREADSYFDNATYHETFLKRGEEQLISPPPHQVSVVFERPNRFRLLRRELATSRGELSVTAASDGKRFMATISNVSDQILDLPAPAALSAATITPDLVLRQALTPVSLENLFPQLDLLLASDTAPAKLLLAIEPRRLADRELKGTNCYRVEVHHTTGKHRLWIDAENYLLRRLELPTEEIQRQLDPQGVMLDWRLWIDFNDAHAGGPLADSLFQLDVPPGAGRVASFTQPTAADPVRGNENQ